MKPTSSLCQGILTGALVLCLFTPAIAAVKIVSKKGNRRIFYTFNALLYA